MSLFIVVSYDVTRNADIWYCYIHGYPSGTPGGFYLLDISHNHGQIHIFQCVVQHNVPLYVRGSLLLCIQPVVVIHQYVQFVKEISSHGNDVVISKIDMARAFGNVRMDPAYALKLGITWGDDVYVDVAVEFSWVHRSAAF